MYSYASPRGEDNIPCILIPVLDILISAYVIYAVYVIYIIIVTLRLGMGEEFHLCNGVLASYICVSLQYIAQYVTPRLLNECVSHTDTVCVSPFSSRSIH